MGPWEAALGDSFDHLHPRLRAYFGTLPAGSVGRGKGEFSVVGTPRRWLWPLLAVLGLQGIIFPAWERSVPFTVENRPVYSGLASSRVFRFASGARTMTDYVVLTPHGLEDRLGRRGLVVARLDATVNEGMLTLTSTSVRICGIPIPALIAPRVTVVESLESEWRHVSLTLDAPVVGRLYEYSGSFTYAVEPRS